MPTLLNSFLDHPVISRTRRNHGLEHATIHVLSARQGGRSLAGHSDAGGFWLLGEITVEEIQSAADEALRRMRAGEHQLAVHPNCGTNLVTAGAMAGLGGALAMFGAGPRRRDKLERLPLAAVLATLALFLAQPLGYRVQQRITTSGQPGDLEIERIYETRRGAMKAHRVVTRG